MASYLGNLGNCNKFYFTFGFKIQMWVWICRIF